MDRDDASGPREVPPAGTGGIDVSLPLAFGAFCLLYGAHYRAYAQCRLRSTTAAEHTARCALGELLIRWPAALTSLPSAVGWGILRRRTAIALRALADSPAPSPDTVHRLVPAPVADAAVLHHGLGLAPEGIADLTGCTPGQARYGLLTFERHLAHQPDGTLRAAVDELRSGRTAAVVSSGQPVAADLPVPAGHAGPDRAESPGGPGHPGRTGHPEGTGHPDGSGHADVTAGRGGAAGLGGTSGRGGGTGDSRAAADAYSSRPVKTITRS